MQRYIALALILIAVGLVCLHEGKTQTLPLLGAGKGTTTVASGSQVVAGSTNCNNTVLDQYKSASTTATSTKISVSSGSNRALVVTAAWGGIVTSPTATWDTAGGSPTNQAMTLLGSVSSGGLDTSALFGLRNPTTGNNLTLSLAWTGSAESFIAGCDWTGVNVGTNDATTFPGFTSGTGVTTVAVTSATGDIVMATSAGAPNVAPTGTKIYLNITSGAVINAMANYMSGAGTVNIGFSAGGCGGTCGIAAVNIKAN